MGRFVRPQLITHRSTDSSTSTSSHQMSPSTPLAPAASGAAPLAPADSCNANSCNANSCNANSCNANSCNANSSAAVKRQNWWTALGLGSVSVMTKSLRNMSTVCSEMTELSQRSVERHSSINPPQPTELDQRLFSAIDRLCLDGVNRCIDQGANVNALNGIFGESALHQAARLRWCAGIDLLLKRGAMVSIENRYCQTPLHFTAIGGTPDCMAALLVQDRSAVWVKDMRGYTPLHDAVVGRDVRCVRLLIEAGADVNVTDKLGNTPLHKCAQSCVMANIVALLNEGADLKAKNNEGETALASLLRNIPNALNRILDHCLMPNKLPKSHKNFELTISFKPLMRKNALIHTDIVRNFIKIGEATVLKHPVCQAFLELKWRHVVKLFLFKIVFYFAFVIVSTILILNEFVWRNKLLKENASINGTIANNTSNQTLIEEKFKGLDKSDKHLFMVAVAMIAVLVLIEIINMMSSFANYFKDMMTIVNWMLFIIFFAISSKSSDKNSEQGSWQHHTASFFTLILWSKAMHMIGQFPGCGIYVSMFTKVAKVIVKMFFVYLSLFIAFAISFHISFSASGVFQDPRDSFMKTLTLMIGEVDYEGLFFNSEIHPLTGTSHVIFFLFLVLISIILSNLLVALAVSDVQGLRQDAHLERLKKQSQLIHQTELIRAFFTTVYKCGPLRRFVERVSKSFHLDLSSARVFVLPNHPQKSRYIQILDYHTKSMAELKVSKDLVELFWQAVRRQESADNLTGVPSAPLRCGSVSAVRAAPFRRATMRKMNELDQGLRVHRGGSLHPQAASVSLEEFNCLISAMERRLATQFDQKLEQMEERLSAVKSQSLNLAV